MKELKKKMRMDIQKKLSNLSDGTRDQESVQIREQLFQTDDWKKSDTIGVTVSRGNEINTYPIIEKAWEEGKTVVVPKCHAKDFSMDFRKIDSFEQLEVVYFGLKEPVVEKTELITPDEIDLLIVPGLLFDEEGFRIGFGGGFYDRYLERYTGTTVSLLHPVQLNNDIPRESFDKPVDYLILPKKVHATEARI
ncbi:5-formyltetrahydrofolate cyclo-ligase [Pseudalkalibacillus berkeleyi]|uniref:5-formyltetrahydrofolate cyclo-ligase n=1 Tax=Pseudalkalibacillus berkeleyi TaxID=1069813 RepID=A0ABS9GYS2_9BACL|nr:5-formyltetrahydrofolate cyclo-ligase [Pseudalkalibacillus berkeleyi]MCF6137912.1 5-formyltetrahydrofolate cyclo-ligase [Pseudalkalibacillus berkeleyi]